MTIIAILLAFGLCHFIRELGRFRKSNWLTSWVNFANDAFNKLPGWSGALGFLVIPAVPVIALLLINRVLISALGSTGAFLLALVVLIYCFGPRDLDTDVAAILESDDEAERGEALQELLGQPVPEDPDSCRTAAVEAVFREGLRSLVRSNFLVRCTGHRRCVFSIAWLTGWSTRKTNSVTNRKVCSCDCNRSWTGRRPN